MPNASIKHRKNLRGITVFDRRSQIPMVRDYCWAHLAAGEEGSENDISLIHYPCLPFIIIGICGIMYAIRQLRKGLKEEKSRAIIKLMVEGMEESITAGMEN